VGGERIPDDTVVTALPVVAVSVLIACVLCLVTVALWRGWRRIAIWSAAATVLGGVSLVMLWLRNFASFVDTCLGLGIGTWFELGAGLLVVIGGSLVLVDARKLEPGNGGRLAATDLG